MLLDIIMEKKIKNILINNYKILSICEFPNLEIVSVLEKGI
jgi:hypothetical protein